MFTGSFVYIRVIYAGWWSDGVVCSVWCMAACPLLCSPLWEWSARDSHLRPVCTGTCTHVYPFQLHVYMYMWLKKWYQEHTCSYLPFEHLMYSRTFELGCSGNNIWTAQSINRAVPNTLLMNLNFQHLKSRHQIYCPICAPIREVALHLSYRTYIFAMYISTVLCFMTAN